MSRQSGRRQPSRTKRVAKAQPERPKLYRPDPGEPISGRRKWAAVFAGTVVTVFVFGAIATAIVEVDDGNNGAARYATIVAIALTPFVFAVAGFVSRTSKPFRTAFVLAPMTIAVFVGLALATRDPVTPTVVAFGLGASWALRFDEQLHVRAWRVWGAVGLGVYSFFLFALSPGLATVMAPFLPFPMVAVIDSITERRAVDAEGG